MITSIAAAGALLSIALREPTCISVNEVAAHGIPGPRVLEEGDVVNIDVSAELGGYYADTGATIVVGTRSPHKEKLCQSSLRALHQGLQKARAGAKISGIGRAIHNEARKDGFTVIRNLSGTALAANCMRCRTAF
ncbi:M24 family metallopeptidase [Paenibacillus allorhizosphaerae]|uniref:M24 family metallopeptidase n=1 Tax=Paenibacillus allorhizosphaerae TaxID=2849866 RepID=UPI0022A869DC|nr:M24 family metallopeptidase [Paenibacillus allorhizosphaerae]